MTRDLNAKTFQATIGLNLYLLGFGLFPMLTVSFREEVGRLPTYVVSAFGFLLMYGCPRTNYFNSSRHSLFQGGSGSMWATNVGGTVADIWVPYEWVFNRPSSTFLGLFIDSKY
ncbi:hypothetical protein K435DRAFT_799221 [Dendrothele bispora CBS 962.96]|uniref:MFS general substrate transporter n=1 Tax=Dendrothele bispora (strain CBS 962.96) TaxID=1314807 RepID=A0A4S8LXX0_DENBC|nr:hypothetical protein K435DRAFT_799221 [Dendrothele bispora CBS 962.96]